MLNPVNISLETDEQKKEYGLELARIKAKFDAELYYKSAKTLRVYKMQKTFMYSFLITLVGSCIAYLLGVFGNNWCFNLKVSYLEYKHTNLWFTLFRLGPGDIFAEKYQNRLLGTYDNILGIPFDKNIAYGQSRSFRYILDFSGDYGLYSLLQLFYPYFPS